MTLVHQAFVSTKKHTFVIVERKFEDAMNAAFFGWAQYRFKHEPIFYAHLNSKAPARYGDRNTDYGMGGWSSC
ncbi:MULTISPECIES: hypothetical protein [Paenibacillus]|uniref:hypothetical protein n=1 Tax=Paenibacillus TaxID=44249 RepID=UPI002811F716|nr:hypothetical protein [Paenibacillus peoriae]